MKLELVEVVDKNDKVLKIIDRKSAKKSDILRVSNIMIINDEDEILLQLRSENSYNYPSYWDCSGGGHVDSGEDYFGCAKRELFEEIGVKTELELLGKHYIELDDGRKHFSTFFKGKYNGEFNIDPNEVTKVQFFTKEEIKKMISNGGKFHPECLFVLNKYFY
ncbi:NUDIX domain-containing protein [Patescibacteria group bacterium]|nr:NUDIX domain-containing protein [Patescibacteria group bacterium]